jgi:hypothetical protein
MYQRGIGQVVSLCSITKANETRYFKVQKDNQLKLFDLYYNAGVKIIIKN